MVDDYLYNGNGALLALFLAGVSSAVTRESHADMKPFTQWDRQTTFLVSIGISLVAFLFLDKIFSIWYANLGAVQMAKVELVGFPETGWAGTDMVPRLQQADAALHSSLESDLKNLTANHRLRPDLHLTAIFDQQRSILKRLTNRHLRIAAS